MKVAIFQSSSMTDGAPGYPERSGQTVNIIRPLTDGEYDKEESDPMFVVQFSDGTETHAFDFELIAS